MSLGDAIGGKGGKGSVKAVAIAVPRLDMKDAAIRLHKAVHGHDIDGIADALRHSHAAYEDECDADGDHDGDEK